MKKEAMSYIAFYMYESLLPLFDHKTNKSNCIRNIDIVKKKYDFRIENKSCFFNCILPPLEKTVIYRLLMKTEEGARLVRLPSRRCRSRRNLNERWTAASLFANSHDREKNGSRRIQVRCLPRRDKTSSLFSRRCFTLGSEGPWPLASERVTNAKKKKGIVKVETLHRFYGLFRTVFEFCLFARCMGEAKYKSKRKRKKTTLRKTLLTIYV